MGKRRVPGSAAAALSLLLVFGARPSAGQTIRSFGPEGSGPGGGPPESKSALTFRQAGQDFLHDAGQIWSAPFRLKGRQIAPLLALAATTAILIAADEDIRESVHGYAEDHPWVGDVGPVIATMGGLGAVAAAGAFFGAGLVFKDDRARDTGYLAASAIAQTFLVDFFIKGMSGRQRPFYEDGVDRWVGPSGFFKRFDPDNDGRYDSFPSGHAATAFSLATVVAMQYRHRAWVPILAYSVAAGVGLARMTEDLHWASDVVLGAVIGHLVARLIVRNHRRRQRLVPVLSCTRRMIALGVRFDPGPFDE